MNGDVLRKNNHPHYVKGQRVAHQPPGHMNSTVLLADMSLEFPTLWWTVETPTVNYRPGGDRPKRDAAQNVDEGGKAQPMEILVLVHPKEIIVQSLEYTLPFGSMAHYLKLYMNHGPTHCDPTDREYALPLWASRMDYSTVAVPMDPQSTPYWHWALSSIYFRYFLTAGLPLKAMVTRGRCHSQALGMYPHIGFADRSGRGSPLESFLTMILVDDWRGSPLGTAAPPQVASGQTQVKC